MNIRNILKEILNVSRSITVSYFKQTGGHFVGACVNMGC